MSSDSITNLASAQICGYEVAMWHDETAGEYASTIQDDADCATLYYHEDLLEALQLTIGRAIFEEEGPHLPLCEAYADCSEPAHSEDMRCEEHNLEERVCGYSGNSPHNFLDNGSGRCEICILNLI